MISDLLLDSCVIAKLVLPERDSQTAEQIFGEALQNGGIGLSLEFAAVEVANVIWKRRHRNLLDSPAAQERLEALFALPIQWIVADAHLVQAFNFALKYDMPVYDALFVVAAEMHSGIAVTSDIALFHKVQGDFPRIRLLH